jgi:cystathionine beta-lyase
MGNPLASTDLTLAELRRRTSAKWRFYPDDVLPMFVAEMDVQLAEPISRALRQAIDLGDTGYPFGPAYPQALADFAARRWGWHFELEQARQVADVMTGVSYALGMITEPGDAVVLSTPVYHPFFRFTEALHRTIVEAPLGENGRIDFAVLQAAFQHASSVGRRSAYLMSNPHNPTGVVHTRAELERVAELAREYGVRVVSDEIHAPLVLPGATFTPYAQLDPQALAVTSASKAWNLAGLKAAVLIAGTQAVEDLQRLPAHAEFGASHFGVISHVAALREGEPWLDELLAGLAENRALLGELLAQHLPKIGYLRPEGTYLAWLDCRELGIEGHPSEFFLERGRVALYQGDVFGTGGAGFVRMNFATTPDLLREAVNRMAQALA